MRTNIIVTNLYPAHLRFESLRVSFELLGYRLVSLVQGLEQEPSFFDSAAAQFVFQYPLSSSLVTHILGRRASGQPFIVLMDDPLAFFDVNTNAFVLPLLAEATAVYTTTANMLPVYQSIKVDAKLVVGSANPLFDIEAPVEESSMRYDWGYIGGLYPQRFRFFWQLRQLLPNLTDYIVTSGLDTPAVIRRIRETRVNVVYGNFSDITDFKSEGTTFRPWEFPYAGAFIVHDDRPSLYDYFTPGQSIVIFKSVHECAELIKYYLPRAEERRRIARNARDIIKKYPMVDFIRQVYEGML